MRRKKSKRESPAAMGQPFLLTSGSQIEHGTTVGRIGLLVCRSRARAAGNHGNTGHRANGGARPGKKFFTSQRQPHSFSARYESQSQCTNSQQPAVPGCLFGGSLQSLAQG